jgi:tRNA 2-(methylsulfanyl)-N6-isopentenyladenosine37 hydroxylase
LSHIFDFMDIQLQCQSSELWVKTVLEQFDRFLLDHAANEKKASGVALNLAAHYPDKPDLVSAMIDLGIEELSHYRDVYKLIRERKIAPTPDEKDPYVNQIRGLIRKGSENYFLDRLLTAAVIEARGQERFKKIADALSEGAVKGFYAAIYKSEDRHANLFVNLAYQYCDADVVASRLKELLRLEATILEQLPIRAALH